MPNNSNHLRSQRIGLFEGIQLSIEEGYRFFFDKKIDDVISVNIYPQTAKLSDELVRDLKDALNNPDWEIIDRLDHWEAGPTNPNVTFYSNALLVRGATFDEVKDRIIAYNELRPKVIAALDQIREVLSEKKIPSQAIEESIRDLRKDLLSGNQKNKGVYVSSDINYISRYGVSGKKIWDIIKNETGLVFPQRSCAYD